jgi:hypothetical protein
VPSYAPGNRRVKPAVLEYLGRGSYGEAAVGDARRTCTTAGAVDTGDHEKAEVIWCCALGIADPEDRWARVRALNSLSIMRSLRRRP